MAKNIYICNETPNYIKALQHDDLGLENSLSHAKKGEERPNHKYMSREWKNGRWEYVYKDQNDGRGVAVNDKQVQVLNQISKIDNIQKEKTTDIVDDNKYFDGTISLGKIMDNDDYNNYKKAKEYYDKVVKDLKNYKTFLNEGNSEYLKKVSGKEYSPRDYVQLMANYTYAKRNLKDSYDKLQKSCEKRFGEIPDHSISSFSDEYYDYVRKNMNGILDAQDSNMISMTTNRKNKR